MNNQITISVGASRHAKDWQPQILTWDAFVEKLKTPVQTQEPFRVYKLLPKTQQDNLKDVGGFVGGTLRDNKRKVDHVIDRSIICLDADNIPPGQTEEVLKRVHGLGCAYAVYSTRKHESAAPRLRIIFPLDVPAKADEYEPVARKFAEMIGMNIFDPTTFQANRLMYWPSISADGEYVHRSAVRGWASTTGMLALYKDWRDCLEWPEVPGIVKAVEHSAKQQGDPLTKKGTIGAFCRSYGIEEAMDTFIPGKYETCDLGPNRYTLVGGSTSGGAIVYDDKFIFSHHATDPLCNRLANSFDMVRMHLFSELDLDITPTAPVSTYPSFKAMTELALEDERVSSLIKHERYQAAQEEFALTVGTEAPAVVDQDWIRLVKLSNATGRPVKTIDNVLTILNNDPTLKGAIGHDELANRPTILKSLPWRAIKGKTPWDDSDDAGLRHYLETIHKIKTKADTADAFAIACRQNQFHDIRDYLNKLSWDGVPRLDTLLIDYLGVENAPYTRDVTRKTLVAAVARILSPGVKFDTALIIIGAQGIGKTTLLTKLGMGYHQEIGLNLKGKETSELLQGYWIIELGELKGLSKAEDADVKQFISRTEDVYREPYGRHIKAFPRQCVFIGTANNQAFLRDTTGNRRFWPVDAGVNTPTKNVFKDLDQEIDQIWAEAVQLYNSGETLYLTGDSAQAALDSQEDHRESNAKEGMVLEFINRLVPTEYNTMSIDARRTFWAMGNPGTVKREKVCALEVWVELFNGDPKMFKRLESMELNAILDVMPGWVKNKKAMRFNNEYGVQKGYRSENSVNILDKIINGN